MVSIAMDRVAPPADAIWRWLGEIPDPEVPAVSIVDLGIVRDVQCEVAAEGIHAVVTITPTYSGCPAMAMIANEIESLLRARGIDEVTLVTRLAPAWTSDWLSDAAREQLRRFGIAPPAEHAVRLVPRTAHATTATSDAVNPSPGAAPREPLRFPRSQPRAAVACPHCGASDTECISDFGSTACKAQYRCRTCREPFDYFKPI